MIVLILLQLFQTSCARLSSGPIPPSPGAQIYLLRGYQDWYSTGIDRLAVELRADGQNAESYREEQWGDLGSWLIAHPQPDPILIGFSYGADDVILMARQLNNAHLPVGLLITIDPVTPASIPPNVKQCVNFYEPNGFRDLFPWLRGVPIDHGQNINIRARTDLNEPDTSHGTIAGNEHVHAVIRRLVKNAVTSARSN